MGDGKHRARNSDAIFNWKVHKIIASFPMDIEQNMKLRACSKYNDGDYPSKCKFGNRFPRSPIERCRVPRWSIERYPFPRWSMAGIPDSPTSLDRQDISGRNNNHFNIT